MGFLSWWLVGAAPPAFAQPPSESAAETGSLPATIPIFPLQDVTLFPGVLKPLHIFEPRYREMLLAALVGNRIIGMVMLQPGFEDEYYGRPPIYSVGCAGVIAQVEELPGGSYNIVLEGLTKFRVKSEDSSHSYRVAEVDAIPETLSDAQQSALRRHRPRLLQLLSSVMPAAGEPTADEFPDAQLVNALAQVLRMKPEQRLNLLERDGPLARARALIDLLGDVEAPR